MSMNSPRPTPEDDASFMSEERLTMLKLRFDESDFGVTLGAPSAPPATFSAPSFVQNKTEYFTLDELEEDLQLYSENLERRILRHIHDDVHEAFITVAAHMEGVRGPLAAVLAPTRSVERRLESCAQEVSAVKEEVLNHLQEAAAHAAEEDACNAEIRCLVLYQRACSTLTHLDGCRGTGVSARYIQLLDELCVTVRGFRGSVSVACTDTRSADEMRSLFASAEAALRSCMSDALVRALQRFLDMDLAAVPPSEPLSEIQPVLDLFVEYDEVPCLITALKDAVIRPRLETHISWSAVHEARKNPATTSTLFERLTQQLVTFVVPLVKVLQVWIDRGGADRPMLAILDVAWPAVSEVIQKRLSGLLNPAMPEVFQASYIACEGVVALLSSNCSTAGERAAFAHQTHSTDDSVVGRWAASWQRHLSVYKSVVHNDEVTSIQGHIPKSAVVLSTSGPYRFDAFKGILTAAEYPLSRGVFIAQVGADLLKESVLAFMRGVEGVVNALTTEKAIEVRTHEGAAVPRSVALGMLWEDLASVEGYLLGPYSDLVAATLSVTRDGDLGSILATVRSVRRKASTFVSGICSSDLLSGMSSAFAVGSQQMVSRIGGSQAFSSTNRPPPPSAYVATLEDRIADFSNSLQPACSQHTVSLILAEAIGSGLASSIQKTIAESIRTAARRQEVLTRKKKRSEDDPVVADDVDKIVVQLFVDLAALRDHALLGHHLDSTDFGAMLEVLGVRASWVCLHKMGGLRIPSLPPAPDACPVLWGIE